MGTDGRRLQGIVPASLLDSPAFLPCLLRLKTTSSDWVGPYQDPGRAHEVRGFLCRVPSQVTPAESSLDPPTFLPLSALPETTSSNRYRTLQDLGRAYSVRECLSRAGNISGDCYGPLYGLERVPNVRGGGLCQVLSPV